MRVTTLSPAALLLTLLPLTVAAGQQQQQPLQSQLRPSSSSSQHQQQQYHHQPLDAAATATSTKDSTPPPYRDALLSLHKSLVSIESITGNENGVGRWLVDYLVARGYTAELQFVAPGGGDDGNEKERFNIVAWPPAEEGSDRHEEERGEKLGKRAVVRADPKVVLTSHIDVVPPYIPYSISDEGDAITSRTMIKGRGSVDAKASVAAMITAIDDLLARPSTSSSSTSSSSVRNDVMLLFVVDEEVAGAGMRAFSDSLARMHPPPRPFSAVIFGEPTENKLACGHKGALFCDITARGVAAHSGYPWLGKSANELVVRALARVLDADLGSSDLFGNTTVNVGLLQGGVAGNVIPERALVKIGVRVAVGPQEGGAKHVEEKIRRILDDVDDEAFGFTCSQGYGSVECDCDVPDFDTITVNYGTDVPNLAGNHTRYLYGPGDILVAHGARENLTVGVLEESVEGYKKLILHALDRAQ
ncbi:Acetylornithine deacetylase [Purpureocillium takamizusanense]|uniref:Acetylornithine deacetylase n=1 Tax=Purpureocillium takamizusanense TaxID=2060973 RepID=A0A9Q8QCH8_9HYPO|nr:Acetylornithine deacetylase [Purpureocillium takamizusanense]UNI17115.1 Acetylornithine deacetylase [Purpureocillium takamizusanense]